MCILSTYLMAQQDQREDQPRSQGQNTVKDNQSTQQVEDRQNCHPSYQGACLNPNASDYDCRGGTGNGPLYTGRVRVVGPDIFGLDRDGDGIGCE